MSETGAEDMTPLTERKSINSSFFYGAASAMRGCSRVSNLRQTSALIAEATIITLYQKKSGRTVQEERQGVVWVWRTDGRG